MPYSDIEKRREYDRNYAKKKRINNPIKARINDKIKYEHRKNKQLAYQQKRIGRRRYWLNYYKLKVGCVSCGYKEAACALDFDHKDVYNKSFPISGGGLARTLKSLFQEIRKCEIVCANCHRVRTHVTNQEAIQIKIKSSRRNSLCRDADSTF